VTEFHANQGHLYKPDRYTQKPEYKLVWHSLGKEGKRNKARIRTKAGYPRIAAGRNSAPHLTHARGIASVGR
jgi:hypothetical protein